MCARLNVSEVVYEHGWVCVFVSEPLKMNGECKYVRVCLCVSREGL